MVAILVTLAQSILLVDNLVDVLSVGPKKHYITEQAPRQAQIEHDEDQSWPDTWDDNGNSTQEALRSMRQPKVTSSKVRDLNLKASPRKGHTMVDHP